MKLIPFVSFKGGAGKTTALMAVASCLVARGERVALFEADENAPLARWRQNAMTNETWSEQVLLLPAASERDLERSYERADSEDVPTLWQTPPAVAPSSTPSR